MHFKKGCWRAKRPFPRWWCADIWKKIGTFPPFPIWSGPPTVYLFLFSSFKRGWFPDPNIVGCLKCQSLNILEYPNRCRQQPGSVSVWSWSYSIELFPRGGFCWAQLGDAWISKHIHRKISFLNIKDLFTMKDFGKLTNGELCPWFYLY